ncbi:hypothetical protein MANES_03G213300v8 [Manihot esculenta]|uniref:Uncharacterized protein n=1 Tax=Manihot esculenta TaxID=3983 RepID=A0ACB7I3P6_MANES|nr:hypothetical protein MANES_03G213300v8 [Manihot esculenta]
MGPRSPLIIQRQSPAHGPRQNLYSIHMQPSSTVDQTFTQNGPQHVDSHSLLHSSNMAHTTQVILSTSHAGQVRSAHRGPSQSTHMGPPSSSFTQPIQASTPAAHERQIHTWPATSQLGRPFTLFKGQ